MVVAAAAAAAVAAARGLTQHLYEPWSHLLVEGLHRDHNIESLLGGYWYYKVSEPLLVARGW